MGRDTSKFSDVGAQVWRQPNPVAPFFATHFPISLHPPSLRTRSCCVVVGCLLLWLVRANNCVFPSHALLIELIVLAVSWHDHVNHFSFFRKSSSANRRASGSRIERSLQEPSRRISNHSRKQLGGDSGKLMKEKQLTGTEGPTSEHHGDREVSTIRWRAHPLALPSVLFVVYDL
jgi:hypothetical protein